MLLNLQAGAHGGQEVVKRFSETEEMTILKQDYEILTSFYEEVK